MFRVLCLLYCRPSVLGLTVVLWCFWSSYQFSPSIFSFLVPIVVLQLVAKDARELAQHIPGTHFVLLVCHNSHRTTLTHSS
jgi:hypothetical protein